MAHDSERLIPRYTERGLIEMPAIAGDDSVVQVREASNADVAKVWLTIRWRFEDAGHSIGLTLDQAAAVRDQIDFVIRHHRMVGP